MLFLLYVNEIPSSIQGGFAEAYLFADDLAVSVFSTDQTALRLRMDGLTNTIKDWCCANSLCLNDTKTVDINFKASRTVNNNVDSVRFLGIHLESNLGWDSHIDQLVKRLSTGIFVLRVLARVWF